MSTVFLMYRTLISLFVIVGLISAAPVSIPQEDEFVPVLRFALCTALNCYKHSRF